MPHDTSPFAELEPGFLRIVAETVICTFTTVDRRGRPRSRLLHPVFTTRAGRPIGWALTSPDSAKARDLDGNPHACCSYWNPGQDAVVVDATTAWVAGDEEKREVWDLFRDTPTPLGWGPDAMDAYGPDAWRNPVFTPLRLTPWSVRVVAGDQYPYGDLGGLVWRDRGEVPGT